MVETKMIEVKPELAAQPIMQIESRLVSWADWWEQWGDETFDAPTVFVDIEPVYRKK